MAGKRLFQSVAEQIAQLIDEGAFPPGTRLPGERELAERLGVSRVTIREAEIALLDHHVVVYKFCADLHFFVTAHVDENEIIVATVLNAFFDAVSLLLRGVVEKRAALENLDLVLLTIDELIDGGIILETDPNAIAPTG